MARVEISEVAFARLPNLPIRPLSDASVQVNERGAGAATVYAAATGGDTVANPIITDANGRIEGWLEEGSYDLVVSKDGYDPYTQPFEAWAGSTVATLQADLAAVESGLDQLVFNVKDSAYGAVGDGSNDDTAEIQAAIDAAEAAGGGTVFFPEGTYKVTTQLDVGSNVELAGQGRHTTLDFSSVASTFTAVSVAGSVGSALTLASDATKGSATVVLNDASSLAADDWIKVSMLGTAGTSDRFGDDDQPRGEIVRIESISTNTLTLYTPLNDTYYSAKGGQVEEITAKENITVRGLRFLGPTNTALAITGLHIEYARDVRVQDCHFQRCQSRGINVWDCWDWRISGVAMRDIELTGLAYGISVGWAAQDGSISDSVFEYMRHGVTLGGGTARRGIVRRVTVQGCHCRTVDAGLDCHASAEDVAFIGNTVIGMPNALSSEYEGIISQATACTIVGNTVYDVGQDGIIWQPLVHAPLSAVIANNIVRSTGRYGIYINTTAGFGDFSGCAIIGNVVEDATQTSIFVDGTSETIENVTVSGNTVADGAAHGIYVSTAVAAAVAGNVVADTPASSAGIRFHACTDFAATGNVVTGTAAQGIRVSATNGTVTGNRVTGATTGLLLEAATTDVIAASNSLVGNTTPINATTGVRNQLLGNSPGVVASVASAATVTLPGSENDVYNITGTTTIDTITATSMAGRVVKLKFASTAGVSESGNVKLTAAFTGTADDTLTLLCDGSSWYETGRAAN